MEPNIFVLKIFRSTSLSVPYIFKHLINETEQIPNLFVSGIKGGFFSLTPFQLTDVTFRGIPSSIDKNKTGS